MKVYKVIISSIFEHVWKKLYDYIFWIWNKKSDRIWIFYQSCLQLKFDFNIFFFLLCFQRTVPSGQTSLVLQPLLSDTEYKVTVIPVYNEGDGPASSQMGRTRKSQVINCYILICTLMKINPVFCFCGSNTTTLIITPAFLTCTLFLVYTLWTIVQFCSGSAWPLCSSHGLNLILVKSLLKTEIYSL